MENNKKSPHVCALILARGGSKGVPGKNIYSVAGKPLLIRCLEPVIASGVFESIWVSTDDTKIADVARSAGKEVQIFERCPEFAHDEAKSVDAANEFLRAHPEVDIVAIIQCSSPFIQSSYLKKAHALMTSSDNYDSIFSVTREKKIRWMESKDYVFPINFDLSNRPRRQDMKGELVENGMFYFAKRDIMEKGYVQGGRMFYVEIPQEHSIDLDSAFDMVILETILQVKKGVK